MKIGISAFAADNGRSGIGQYVINVLGRLPATWRTRTTWLPALAGVLATLLLVVALARPLKGREESLVFTEGIDIVLVVDASSSMLEQSGEPFEFPVSWGADLQSGFLIHFSDSGLLLSFTLLNMPFGETPMSSAAMLD